MNRIELQRACLADGGDYAAYYRRFFSTRLADESIPPVERVTQEVLRELSRLQKEWEALRVSTEPAPVGTG